MGQRVRCSVARTPYAGGNGRRGRTRGVKVTRRGRRPQTIRGPFAWSVVCTQTITVVLPSGHGMYLKKNQIRNLRGLGSHKKIYTTNKYANEDSNKVGLG